MPKKTTTTRTKKLSGHADAKFSEAMILNKLPAYFLIACLLAIFAVLYMILEPFITVIFVGAVLAVAFYPIYLTVLKWFRGWKRLASFVTCIAVIFVIVAPLTVFVALLTTEAVDTYTVVSDKINSGVFDQYLQWRPGGYFFDLSENIKPVVDLESLDLKKNIIGMAQGLSTFLVSQTANIAKGLSAIALSLIVMLFTMYYFFKDGKEIVGKVGLLSPLPRVYETQLFNRIKIMVKAVVVGVFLTAIAQGLVGGIGFAIAGISNPIFWGTAIAFFSLVPVVGTAVIWVPASIILLILGSYGAALFVFLWGMFAIGAVDNILRPYLIGGKAHTYPLMTFLVVLGGVITLGLKGVIIGPLVLIILMSFLHIYEAEYKKVLKK